MPYLITILSSVGVSALLASALIFLAKNWITERLKNAIKHEYDEKLETHKAQLHSEYDREIEQLKARLQLAAAERSIKLARVFEKTAEIICTTYAKLWAFQKAVEDYTQQRGHSDFAQNQELNKNVQSQWADVLQYFLPHKIYFPPETAKKIIWFLNTLQMTSGSFGMIEASRGGNPDTIKNLHRNFDEYKKEASELLTVLEEDFQKILGMEGSLVNLPDSKSTNLPT